MKKRISENVDRVTGPKVISILLAGIELSKEENTLIYWKMDFLSDEDAQEILDCSRATLFNRWNKLKEKIVQRYNADPLKSLNLFQKVETIKSEIGEE